MTKQPKHGDESTCRHCGGSIRYYGKNGRKWKHWPGPRRSSDRDTLVKLHEAEPVKRKAKR